MRVQVSSEYCDASEDKRPAIGQNALHQVAPQQSHATAIQMHKPPGLCALHVCTGDLVTCCMSSGTCREKLCFSLHHTYGSVEDHASIVRSAFIWITTHW